MVEISITNANHSIQWLEMPFCGVTTEGGATVCLNVKVALCTYSSDSLFPFRDSEKEREQRQGH